LLPVRLRVALAILVLGFISIVGCDLVLANREKVLALAPQYQQSVLAAIQKVAAFLRIDAEPTWASLRQDLLAQMNIQRLLGSMLVSVSSIIVSLVVVLLYAVFLSVERRSFTAKLAKISSNPRSTARIREVIADINARIGSYLALKTILSLLLGAISWLIMAFFGLEFAAFWAVLIVLLNYIPYLGSVLGVLFPLVMAVVQFDDPNVIVSVWLALTTIQFLIGNFLDPYVMGSSLNLSPFAILVSLAVWSELWGIPGAFLAVPITAILTIVFSEFAGTRPIAVLLSRSGDL